MTSTEPGPTLADITCDFPHWGCWHANLRYQITRAEALGIRR